jgi:hypothetical protein
MTYVTIRRQYLVITNGGHNCLGTARGDAIIAPARKLKRVAAKSARAYSDGEDRWSHRSGTTVTGRDT